MSEDTTTKKKNVVATEETPKPEQAPKYQVPLKELDIGKAGIGDLYNKINEQTRLINDLLKVQGIDKNYLLTGNKTPKKSN